MGDRERQLENRLRSLHAQPMDENRKKILLVDDSAIMLRRIRGILVEQYEVWIATSGEAALKLMEKKIPDMLFLDYEMPGMNGLEVIAKMRETEAFHEIPVVFLTGEADRSRISDIDKYNLAGYIVKPPQTEQIKEVVEQILGE